ncbi:hypothetical protein EB001_04875 [bacterium]|jgi:hypothetical protein|nr:hypothetical protein [bacterium]
MSLADLSKYYPVENPKSSYVPPVTYTTIPPTTTTAPPSPITINNPTTPPPALKPNGKVWSSAPQVLAQHRDAIYGGGAKLEYSLSNSLFTKSITIVAGINDFSIFNNYIHYVNK